MKLAIKPWITYQGYPQRLPARDEDGAAVPASDKDEKLRDAGEPFQSKAEKANTIGVLRHIIDGTLKGMMKDDDPVRSTSVYGAIITLPKKAKEIELGDGDAEWLDRLLDRRLGKALKKSLGYDEDSEITYGLHRYGNDLHVVRGHLNGVKAS